MDTNFKMVSVLDVFISFIWTDRYYEYGDFELYTRVSTDILSKIQSEYYLLNKESEHLMIVENIEIETDLEDGHTVKITGRSLESILDRRIVWSSTIISGNIQDCIKKLLNDSIISPSISERKIDNFIFDTSNNSKITNTIIEETEYNGDNLYEIISGLCSANDIGFKVVLNKSNQFVFSLYVGEDRSYEQTKNPYVTFSPEFDNLINSNYVESIQDYKNVTLVAGEKDDNDIPKTASTGNVSGLSRRELYTEATDINQKQEDDTTLTDEEYKNLLIQRGNEALLEHKISVTFDGEFDATQMYTYNKDFFMGDVVQVANEYGIESKARIIEFIQSQDTNGYSMYPTFSIM